MNSPALLGAAFGAVEVRRYDDALHVTDAQALVDYVLSAASVQALPRARETALAASVREQVAHAGGTLTIAKRSGIVCGHKL